MVKYFLRKLISSYHRSNNERYCKYLKNKGITIGGGVKFRNPEHTVIDFTRPRLITIGENVDINDNFTIITHDFGTFVFREVFHDFVPSSGAVKIGNNVVFGRDVTILKGVTIGDNCIIGLGSVVTKDIPSNSVACGSPCHVICTLDEYYKKRKKQSVQEAIDYGRFLLKTKGEVFISDFTEEWSLFFREEDFKKYPEMHSVIDFRLKNHYREFFDSHTPVFNGFEEFRDALKAY